MKFEMVGTGSAFGEGLNSSGYLVLNDMLLVIDCGDKMVKAYEDLLPLLIEEHKIKRIMFVITHLHPDHVMGLPSIIMFLKIFHNNIDVTIISGSNESSITLLLEMSGIKNIENLFARNIPSLYTTTSANYYLEINLIENNHRNMCFSNNTKAKTYSILIKAIDIKEKKPYKLYYSGDTPTFRLPSSNNESTTLTDDLIDLIKYPEESDYAEFYHEVAFYENCEGVHTSYLDILTVLTKMIHPKLREKLSDKIFLYHCDFNKVIVDFFDNGDLEALKDVALLNKYTTFMFTSINKQEDFNTNLLRFIEELSPIDITIIYRKYLKKISKIYKLP